MRESGDEESVTSSSSRDTERNERPEQPTQAADDSPRKLELLVDFYEACPKKKTKKKLGLSDHNLSKTRSPLSLFLLIFDLVSHCFSLH
jgi:hypothetical protein